MIHNIVILNALPCRVMKDVGNLVNILQGRGSQVGMALKDADLVADDTEIKVPPRCNTRVRWGGLCRECAVLTRLVDPLS
jgi:hypothetical protein